MSLQEEKIQDDRICGTPEIGCRAPTPSPACVRAGQVHAGLRPCWSGPCRRADTAVQIRDGGVAVTAATRVERIHLLTIDGKEAPDWSG